MNDSTNSDNDIQTMGLVNGNPNEEDCQQNGIACNASICEENGEKVDVNGGPQEHSSVPNIPGVNELGVERSEQMDYSRAREASNADTAPEVTAPVPNAPEVAGNTTSCDDVIMDEAGVKDTTSFGEKFLRTIVANAAYLGVTMNLGLIGSSLLDFALLTGGTMSQLASVFTWRAVMGLTASLLLGPLADKIDRYFLCSAALFCSSILTAVAPLCSRIEALLIVLALPEFFGSLIGMVTHLICTSIWKKDSGPSLQALNLMATIGYTLSPLILKPFLAPQIGEPDSPSDLPQTVMAVSYYNGESQLYDTNSSFFSVELPIDVVQTETRIQYAYFIVAIYDMILAVIVFAVFCKDGCKFDIRDTVEKEEEDGDTGSNNPRFRVELAICFFVFNIFYGAVEVGYAGLLLSFVVKYLGWTKDDGTSVTALLQGSNAVVTALAVVFAKFIRSELLVGLDIAIVIVAMTTLSIGAKSHSLVTWLCTSALGAGYATIMPASFTWINREMALTGRFSAAYWSGFFLGFMSLPSLTGWLFEAVGPMWLPYITLLAGFGMAALFVVINVVIMREHRRTKTRAAEV